MKQNFVFQVTAPDVDALLPEVSSALEQWMELFSRRKYPKLWALTDRINRWNKAPTARAKRRRQGQVQGLVNWIMAMVLLPVAFLAPDSPVLLVGTGGCGRRTPERAVTPCQRQRAAADGENEGGGAETGAEAAKGAGPAVRKAL